MGCAGRERSPVDRSDSRDGGAKAHSTHLEGRLFVAVGLRAAFALSGVGCGEDPKGANHDKDSQKESDKDNQDDEDDDE